MGGREKEREEMPDREAWITEISDSRLAGYERMLASRGRDSRVDGSARIADGAYFADLVSRERARRGA